MVPQPTPPVWDDAQHDDDLSEERAPRRPVQDGRDGVPRRTYLAVLKRDGRNGEQRGDEQRDLQAALDFACVFVHAVKFDGKTVSPRLEGGTLAAHDEAVAAIEHPRAGDAIDCRIVLRQRRRDDCCTDRLRNRLRVSVRVHIGLDRHVAAVDLKPLDAVVPTRLRSGTVRTAEVLLELAAKLSPYARVLRVGARWLALLRLLLRWRAICLFVGRLLSAACKRQRGNDDQEHPHGVGKLERLRRQRGQHGAKLRRRLRRHAVEVRDGSSPWLSAN